MSNLDSGDFFVKGEFCVAARTCSISGVELVGRWIFLRDIQYRFLENIDLLSRCVVGLTRCCSLTRWIDVHLEESSPCSFRFFDHQRQVVRKQ